MSYACSEIGFDFEGAFLDYIDLYLIHDPFKGKDLRLETYRALLDAQRARKVRTVGVSNL